MKIIGVDQDPQVANNILKPNLSNFVSEKRLQFISGRFSTLKQKLKAIISEEFGYQGADAILLDLGYSNNQVIYSFFVGFLNDFFKLICRLSMKLWAYHIFGTKNWI